MHVRTRGRPDSCGCPRRAFRWILAPAAVSRGGVVAAEDFDDGRTDVPGGVAAPVERVLVVGAGVAGLTAANAPAVSRADRGGRQLMGS